MMKRTLLALLFAMFGAVAHAADTIEVWKDPGCGCCTKWVDHLKAAGLAVPGMPLGSPGMEADRTQPYDVLLFTADGRTRVYRHYL